MPRTLSLLIALGLIFSTTACLISSVGNLTSSSPPDPTSARLSQINAELAGIEQQQSKLQSDRSICESQRNESFLELTKLMGMGPKLSSAQFGEDQTDDPGMLISMHNQNVNVAREEINNIDAKMTQLAQQAAKLKAERAALEQAAAKSSKTLSSSAGSCFTPDTRVLLTEGSKSISTISAGETVMVYNEATGETDYRQVLKAFQGKEDHYFLLNKDVRATALHRFLTDNGWVRAKDLEVGMKLKTRDGWVALESKKLIEAHVDVFNMEVDEHHDFYVAGASQSYLVHNTGGGGGGGK
jgi:hypothetical protein